MSDLSAALADAKTFRAREIVRRSGHGADGERREDLEMAAAIADGLGDVQTAQRCRYELRLRDEARKVGSR